MKTQHQYQIPTNFSEDFGNESFAFIRQLLNDTAWIESNIEVLLRKHPVMQEGKIVYELANLIKTEIVEDGLEKLSDLPNAYVDIICEAIYSCDCYEIAKEIYQQYKSFNKIEVRKELIDC